jgi:arsenical pump membrane protein
MPQVALLAGAVAAVLLAHHRIRPGVAVGAFVTLGLATGLVDMGRAGEALSPLRAPLAFLATAVPLAMLLDRVGFFDAAAERVMLGHHIRPALWGFAAIVTTLFNLDAAIVLLTPLYLRIARRHGLDPVNLAFQPVLLASLASSALPVSNLTNLIAAEQLGLTAGAFLIHLGPASAIATMVGWFAYRHISVPEAAPVTVEYVAAPDPRAWRYGLPAVAVLLAGFTLGDHVGIPAWAVAGTVTVALVPAARTVPWRAIPLDAATVASGFAILTVAAQPHLGLDRVLSGTGPAAGARALLVGVVGANTINNLPALLVGLPNLAPDTAWVYLASVNTGPTLWLTGSLAGLLWADIMLHNGHPITPLDYARTGIRVGLPSIAATLAAVTVTNVLVY